MAFTKDAFGTKKVPSASYTKPTPSAYQKPASGASGTGAKSAATGGYAPKSSNSLNYEQRAEQQAIRNLQKIPVKTPTPSATAATAVAAQRTAFQQVREDSAATAVASTSVAPRYVPESSKSDKEQQLAEQLLQTKWRQASGGASGNSNASAAAARETPFQQVREEDAANAAQSWRETPQEQDVPSAFTAEEQLRAMREKLIGEEVETPAPGLLNREQTELLSLVTELPEDFPFEEWDTLSTKQQRRIMEQTDLSREEQWILLNATTSIRTIADIWALVHKQEGYGLTDDELISTITQLQNIGALRTGAQTRSFYLGSDQRQDAFLRYIKELEEEVYKTVEQRATVHTTNVTIRKNLEKLNSTALAMLDTPPATTPIPVMGRGSIPRGNGEKAYVFYTDKPEAEFGEQAKYYNNLLKYNGYDAERICIDNVAEFKDAWKNMNAKTGAAVIICHCNGMSLLFEHGTRVNAISANGENSEHKPLPAISKLEGPGASLLYLFACNAAHEELLASEGTNVADAFRDLSSVDEVYAYDGSVGFGTPFLREGFGAYPARLAENQVPYYDVYDQFDIHVEEGTPSGLQVYTDD